MKERTVKKVICYFLALAMLIACLPAGLVLAEDPGPHIYYVSNGEGASDDNAGSEAAPFATIAKAVGLLSPGDTLVMEAGNYSEALVLSGLKGTAEAPVTIQGNGEVNITAAAYSSYYGKNYTLYLSGCENVHINNLNLTFAGAVEPGDCYTVGLYGSKNIRLENSYIGAYNGTYAAFNLGTDNDGVVLDSNYIEGSDNAFYGYGFKNITLTNNIITEWWGLHFESSTSTNSIISNNIFTGTGEHFYGGSYSGNTITNNIFFGNPYTVLSAGNTVGNNCVASAGQKTSDSDIVASAADIFVSGSDYHLKEGSPCIDAGTPAGLPQKDRDGKWRYGPADIGAYTYGTLIFVDAQSAAGGDGQSPQTAFNSLTAANSAIVPGATVLIKPGSYTGGISLTGTGDAASKSIAIQIDGSGTVSINGGASPAIALHQIANVKIEGLSLSSSGDRALLADGASNCDVSGCTFTTATFGIEITGNTKDSEFHNNLFNQNDQKGIWLKDSSNNKIYNNIFQNYKCILNEGGNFTNTQIMNNVFVSYYGDGADIILKGANTDNTIANNIFKAENTSAILTSDAATSFYDTASDNMVDYNLYDSSSSLNAVPERETHSVLGNPLFVSGSDYHLQFGSAAINRGTETNAPLLDRDGGIRYGKTDIGAFEYSGTSSDFFVTGQTPQGSGVNVNSAITVTLSEKTAEDNNNFTDNIIVTANIDGTPVKVDGSFSAADEGDGTKITFTPAQAMKYDTTYTVTVKKELLSVNGNYLSADVKWNFTNEAFIMDAYYIAPNGSDSNLGTIDSPKKTAASVINKLKAGDTIYFREGTYNGIMVLQQKAGTADKPITIRNYQNEKVVLTSDHPDYILYLGHCQYVNVEGLTFAPNESQNGDRGVSMYIDNHTASYPQSTNFKVTNCRFEHCATAISVRDLVNIKVGDFEISNNVIVSNNGWGLYFQEVAEKAGCHGRIFNNVIYGAAHSIQLWGENNGLLFYNNTFADTYDFEGGSGRFDVYPVQNVNRNTFSSDLVFKNNIFTKPIRTQLEGGRSIIDAAQNNVFDHNVYSIASTDKVTYNGGGEGPTLSFSQLQGTGLEQNGKTGTVTFADVTNDARIILASNPAIDAADTGIISGVDAPATDIKGNTRETNDAGAYAYDKTFVFVGPNDGTADGSPSKPYPSIGAAISAGGKSIQMMAGTYSQNETIDMANSTGDGNATVVPYGGEVVLSGTVNITGSADKAITLKNLILEGDTTITGQKAVIDGCSIKGSIVLNTANGAAIINNIFTPKAADALTISGSQNCSVTNNVITERNTAVKINSSSTSNKIYNNTFYGNAEDVNISGGATGNTFKNNIISTNIATRAGNTFDYNLYNADTISSAELDAISETNAVKAPAEFINVRAKDYRIYKLSPCAGAGIKDADSPAADINGFSRSNPPDIGAYAVSAIKVEYYVDKASGNDSNSGLNNAPFKTIAQALETLRQGETVIVKAGTYTENISLADRAGKESGEYTVKADGTVVLNGLITVNNTTGASIEGFTVNAGANNTAISLVNSPMTNLSNITATNTKYGISAANCANLVINKVTISNVEKGIISDGSDNAANKTEISQSKINQASDVAIDAKNKVTVTLTSSIISNSTKGILGTTEASFFILNNTFSNNSGLSIDITQPDGNATDLDIVNNIFSRSSGSGVYSQITKGWGFNSEYNLYNAAADDAVVHFYNADWTLSDVATTKGDETRSLLGDPMFKNAAAGDLTLQKGSPAARKATKKLYDSSKVPAPAVDFAGTAYSALGQDIGAYYTPYSLKTIHLAGDNAGWSDGTGTIDSPVRTFRQAVDLMDSADTIIVHKGVYSGRYDMVNKHGVADAPCIIKACNDPDCPICAKNASLDGPVFTGKTNYLNRDEEATSECMTQINNSSYITIDGLNVTGFRGAGIWTMYSDNIVLKNLRIWDIDTPQQINSGVQGLLVNFTTNSLFKDIDIWDIGQTRLSQADHGAYVGHSSDCIFDGIKVHKSPGGGIQFYAGDNFDIHTTDCVIKNCVFSDSNYGLILCGIEDFTVTNNTFYDSWGNDLYLDWNVRNNLFQNNIFYNDRTAEYDSEYGKVKPVVIGYQYNTVRTNADKSTTDMVVDNTFKNNLYEYKGFPAMCRFGAEKFTIDEFIENENAADTNNKYIGTITGNTDFRGSFDGITDEYDKAQSIFNNMLDINADSACINQGESQNAPAVDAKGRVRRDPPDIGAYEYFTPELENAINAVNIAITGLPAANRVALANKDTITAARALVSTAKGKGAIDQDFPDLQKLIDCEVAMESLEIAISDAEASINALPVANQVTLANKTVITAAREAVNTAKSKGAIDQDFPNLQKLIDCEAMIYNLEHPATNNNNNSGQQTPSADPVTTDGYSVVKPLLNSVTGTATADITPDAMAKLIAKAVVNADGEKEIKIEIQKIDGAKVYEQSLPAATVSAAGAETQFVIRTPIGTLTVPENMFKADDTAGASKVKLSIALVEPAALEPGVREKVGRRPVVELSASVDGKKIAWNNSDAPVTISVDYTPTAEELKNPEHIVVWYIDGNGKLQAVPSGRYDPKTGKVTFTTTHFSEYAVGFVTRSFEDLAKYSWLVNPAEVLASKGILEGTSEKTFSPDKNITRGEYLTWLVKTLGLTATYSSSFNDVKKTDACYEALGIAKKLGLAKGTVNNNFEPDRQISRQDMMVLTVRALKLANVDLKDGTTSDIKQFADSGKVSKYAVSDVAAMIQAGLIKGSGKMINPTGTTTRAEAAVLLYRIYNR